MAGVFSTGISGLKAAQTALDTISHNIANANTVGYSRQSTQITSQIPVRTGNGFIGSGVVTTGITASVSQLLESQLSLSTSNSAGSSQLDALYATLQQRISGDANGIGSALSDLTAALSQAAANPSSLPARQLVYSQAGLLAQRFSATSEFVASQRETTNQALSNAAKQANDLISQVASLNDQIAKVEPRDAAGNVLDGQKANDLRDQRQQAINNLSQYIQVQAVDTPEGQTLIANGIAVVIGSRASTLAAVDDPTDPTRKSIALQTLSGSVYLDPEKMGGKVGALGQFLNEGINSARAGLDQFAALITASVNSQQAKGVDLYGAAGTDLLKAAAPISTPTTGNTNAASLSVSVNLAQSLASDYRVRFDGSNYNLIRASDDTLVSQSATGPLTGDGLSISVTGSAATGDEWYLRPFGDASGAIGLTQTDPRRLALASPIKAEANLANTGTGLASAPKVTSGLPLNANLTSAVSITFTSPTTFDISGPGIGTLTGVAYTPESPISYNGWTMQISGAPKVGDKFSVTAAPANSGDASNGNQLLEALTGKNFLGGSATLADVFGLLQSDIGAKAGLAQTQAKSDSSLLDIARSERESFSGVNLDEEAANLARWQQIYQANAKVMSIAQDLFASLINTMGG